MKRVINTIVGFLLLLPFVGSTQQLQRIAKPPSNEIYDLMIDKKGFLWVAHSLGISRYDGVSFTSFTNPEQSAVGMSGLLEDNYGRIWFHNFNGQVFYIKDEKMVYFKQYDFRNTISVMMMGLSGDSLYISSLMGLFICNTKNLQCSTEEPKDEKYYKGTFSFCMLNNNVLSFTPRSFFIYNPRVGQYLIQPQNLHDSIIRDFGRTARLLPHVIGDTILLVDNYRGIVAGLKFYNNQVYKIFEKHYSAHINTVTSTGNNIWVNTGQYTVMLWGKDTIKGHNLSSIIQDANGNSWFGSLTQGLLTLPPKTGWQQMNTSTLEKTDNIRCFFYKPGLLISASQQGKLLINTNDRQSVYDLNKNAAFNGTVDNMQAADSTHYFIFTSKQLFLLDINRLTLQLLYKINAKGIVVTNSKLFLGTAENVRVEEAHGLNLKFANTAQGRFTIDDSKLLKNQGTFALQKKLRCRALIFDSTTNSILISLSDGLQALHDSKLNFILYNGQPLNVSSFATANNKIYAATFNKGLFTIENGVAVKVANDIESPLDAITKIKRCNNHLWLFRTHDIQLLDVNQNKFIHVPQLPAEVPDISDIEEDSTNIYLATYHGMYTLPLASMANFTKVDITLRYVLVNNTDSILNNDIVLPNNKNNLLFKLAVPVYTDADRVSFKYNLNTGGSDTTWYYTQEGQRDMPFNALKYGDYTLTVIAVKDGEAISTQPLVYRFTINRPWYATWIFYLVAALAIISATIAIQQYRLRQILKIERVRRKIASDLHDDIGSTLSSINVYSEIAKREDDNKEYINTIQQNAVSIINNLDDLVWNINPKNDLLENMIARMRQFAEPLLVEKNIECAFNIDADNLQASVTPDVRTNIYLLFKEAINNSIKHSGCTACAVNILQRGKAFTLAIADNGKGFDGKIINRHRNGLHNMQQRAADINGEIVINSTPHGQGTTITLSCNLK